MRKVIAMGVLCLWASALWAGGKMKPLNVKTGLWQSKSTITQNGSMGIPPGMAARLTPAQRARIEAAMAKQGNGTPTTHSYKSCVTQKDLNQDPFTDRHSDFKCQEKVIQSTGTEVELREACSNGSIRSEVHVHFHADSPGHVTGTGEALTNMGGHTMKSNLKIDSKWLATSCPAGVH